MRNDLPLKNRALALIERLRQPLVDPVFWSRHRRRARDFTRECVLTFPVLLLLLLQKSLKSLQTHMHEFLGQLAGAVAPPQLSGGALTHARAKLRASAFVELNAPVLAAVYGPEHAALVQRWQGHRLLSVDSSLVRLPGHAAVGEKFGWVQCANHHGPLERYPQGRVSVLYDVLNQIGLEGRLAGSTVAETQLAHEPDLIEHVVEHRHPALRITLRRPVVIGALHPAEFFPHRRVAGQQIGRAHV